MPRISELAVLLRPWWVELGTERLTLEARDANDHISPLCVALGFKQDGRDQRQVWDALELLLLAAMVKPEEFMTLVQEKCRTRSNQFDANVVVPCCLQLNVTKFSYGMRSMETMWALRKMDERSDAFLATRSALLAMEKDPGRRAKYAAFVIPVKVNMVRASDKQITEMLEHLIASQDARAREDNVTTQEHPWGYSFQLEIVSCTYDLEVLSSEFVQTMERYTKRGLRTDLVCFPSGVVTPMHQNRLDYKSIVRLARIVATEASEVIVQESVPVICPFLLSSLRHSSTVRSLILSKIPNAATRNWSSLSTFEWRWLFYGLFSSEATHSIKQLEILTQCLPSIPELQAFLRSPRPFDLMLSGNNAHESVSQPLQVVLKSGTFVYLDLDAIRDPGQPDTIVPEDDYIVLDEGSTTHNPRAFDVVKTIGDVLTIVVPGYGRCWIKRQDVVDEIPLDMTSFWSLESHAIRNLVVRIEHYTGRAEDCVVKAMLALIGRPLTTLKLNLQTYAPVIDDAYLASIWTSCPNLNLLDIFDPSLTSFTTLVDAYASGMCHMSSLALRNCCVPDCRSVKDFANALADPDTAIAKRLRQLDLSFAGTSEVMTEQTLKAFCDMLQTNHRLQYLSLTVRETGRNRFRSQFDKFHGQLTGYLHSPLPTDSKCAFLSVITAAQASEEKKDKRQALAHFDSHVVSLIFRMAARTLKRTVLLQ